MKRIVVDGNSLALKIAREIKHEIEVEQHKMKQRIFSLHQSSSSKHPLIINQNNISKIPRLDIINIGMHAPSLSYILKKIQMATVVGIDCHLHQFMYKPQTSSNNTLKLEKIYTRLDRNALSIYQLSSISPKQQLKQVGQLICRLNAFKSTSGIILQLPIPQEIRNETFKLTQLISPTKDVDCLTLKNRAALIDLQNVPFLLPCTPKAVLRIFDEHNIQLQGKNAVMIGRSNLVGLPMAHLMLRRNASVQICHHLSINVAQAAKMADIVVSATGVPRLIRQLKSGGISIDIGISRDQKGKLIGDICEESKKQSSLTTPVPKGVGPLTVIMLINNTFKVWKAQNQINELSL